uniref:TSA: Wollemia nobilis Ref_Wollemi_Transcript_9051_1514 transcribed RNA sequence n=1 Tax=Wollemia nobilis TaxID=56998 RepID=A0A0C9S966_9CONI
MAGLSQTLLNSVHVHVPRFRALHHRLPSTSKNALSKGFSWNPDSSKARAPTWRLRHLPRCSTKEGEDSSGGPAAGAGSALEERPGKLPEGLQEEYLQSSEEVNQESPLSKWLYPSKEELPDDKEMSLFDHLEELRQRIFVSVLAVGAAILACFAFSKDLIYFLEAPVSSQGVRFLQLSPGEFFFTTIKVSGYSGLLLGSPVILYEVIAFVLPGLTKNEKRFLGPIVLGSSVLFYAGLAFSYEVLTPAALNFFVSYAEGVVESLWSIDQYFEFVLVLMFSTGLAFQVPVIQLLLGQTRLVTGDQMLAVWRYVVVGAVIAAAILTPSTDPLTQVLLAGPLIGLYISGAWIVKLTVPQNSTT